MDIHPRIWWDGTRGALQSATVRITLEQSPRIGALTYHEIDFCPSLNCSEVRERAVDRRRDMEPAEVMAAMLLIEFVAAGAIELVRKGMA